jgi:arylsulfatase A-like enzyme
VAVLVLLCVACDSSPRRLLRLGSLIAAAPAEKAVPVALPGGTARPHAPYEEAAGLNAARIASLRLRARGTAPLARLTWKLAGDHGFLPFRSLTFALAPDGREHSYEIDLQREAYWTGRVKVLRLEVGVGELQLLDFIGEPATDPYRSMSLRGDSLPSLPGLGRIEIRLPDDLPRGSVLEAHLGLVPEFNKPGTRAVFRAWREEDGQRELWFEQDIEGPAKADKSKEGESPAPGAAGAAAAAGPLGWRLLRQEIPRGGIRGGGKLVLEVEASRYGEPLPEGVALWGDPMIVTPGRKTGKNLVVILVDTLRADFVGAYGSRDGLTPNLDRLAAEGTRFEELLSPAPWTLASVSSLMTGLQPQTHGAGVVYDANRYAPTSLTGGVRTLAESLHDAGFYTFGVYHNIYVNPAFGLQQGFDEYVSREVRAGALVDRALAGLKQYGSDRRFFLYLHFFDPHNPYEPPKKECAEVSRRFAPDYHGPLGCVADRRPELPIPPPEDRRWHLALYRGEIAYTDRQIGRFLDGLDDLGLDDDTVVAVLSDHGEEFWTRLTTERAWGYEPNGDHGHTLYQELLQVPGVLRIPGREPSVVRGPVQMVDLFPTLLRLAGVAPPPSQGEDLTPRLAGGPPTRPLLLADAILHGQPRWSVRRGPWKLIVPRQPGPPLELYDLEHDPGETRNLAAAQPAIVAGLRARGERELEQRKKDRARFVAGDDSLGATYLEWNHITKLRSLGYLR